MLCIVMFCNVMLWTCISKLEIIDHSISAPNKSHGFTPTEQVMVLNFWTMNWMILPMVSNFLFYFASFKGGANTADQAIKWHKSFPTVNLEDNYPWNSCLLHKERKPNTKWQHKKYFVVTKFIFSHLYTLSHPFHQSHSTTSPQDQVGASPAPPHTDHSCRISCLGICLSRNLIPFVPWSISGEYTCIRSLVCMMNCK